MVIADGLASSVLRNALSGDAENVLGRSVDIAFLIQVEWKMKYERPFYIFSYTVPNILKMDVRVSSTIIFAIIIIYSRKHKNMQDTENAF